VVLIVLVLMAALALEVAATAATHGRLAEHGMNEYLLRTAAEGRREILRSAILFSKKSSPNVTREDMDCFWHNHDLLGQWSDTGGSGAFAQTTGEGATGYKNTDVTLLAWAEDERAKLCLLGLVPKPTDEGTGIHDRTRKILIRLIDVYREPWSDLDLTESDAEEMVDALVEYLQTSIDDDDEVPIPSTPDKIGRIQSLNDLQHISGWSPERLFDVKDPDWDEDEDARLYSDSEDEEPEEGIEDQQFFRQNGVPGLVRFLTFHAQGGDDPQIRINFNTAPYTLLRAMFEPQNEELAQAIVEHRREGVGDSDDATSASSEDQSGFFTGPADLAKVEGIEDNWQTEFPDLAALFDVDSRTFSMWVISKVVQQEAETGATDEDVIPEVLATYQYHEIVEYVSGSGTGGAGSSASLSTRLVERRRDPFFNRQ